MATLHPRDVTGNFDNRRRGHAPQISISDDNHHVTEAIGDMYGDNEYNRRDSRPLSFTPTSPEEERASFTASRYEPSVNHHQHQQQHHQQGAESPLARSLSGERFPRSMNGAIQNPPMRQSSLGRNHGASSPTQSAGNMANQAFPLNDIDYESSPAAVQQELSNLQAIRRMSMNVDAADPDLPGFSSNFPVPSIPSTPSSDEDDTSRLFWVPARLHPELAPKEFKTFVEERVDKIRRRSGDETSLTRDPSDPGRSNSKIQRRKSMLSKTISSGADYQDGAEVLERKKSKGSQTALDQNETTLSELEELVNNNDPSNLVRKLSIDTSRQSLEAGNERTSTEDMPILPATPTGQSLKRSTRTNYRRGSLREGKRVPPSRRATGRVAEGDQEDAARRASMSDETPQLLSRVQTEPIWPPPASSEKFSAPRHQVGAGSEPDAMMSPSEDAPSPVVPSPAAPPPSAGAEPSQPNRPTPVPFKSRIASNGRTTAPLPGYERPQSLPQITETSPQTSDNRQTLPSSFNYQYPERKSSHEFSSGAKSLQTTPIERPPIRSGYGRQAQQTQTLDDMANTPSLMPGLNTRTDAFSFIPTFPDEKKSDQPKRKKEKDSSEKKSSWGWLLGGEDRESKKEEKESSKKSKSKNSKILDKSTPHDTTRLDVLQTTSETSTRAGRESLVLDRDSIKLDDERKRDSKKSHDKKEKESGLFSSLFGGSKKKSAEREASARKSSQAAGLSPDPPARILRADIDYNWTRFSILEERAIYRMAHIKLANPRRALYSQVLLSNFMYSYLAKVQQMHPQIQIPQFATQSNKSQQQQQQQDQKQQKQEETSEEFAQWQLYQEYQPQSSPSDSSSVDITNSSYIDDYDPGHQQQEDFSRSQQYYHHHQQQMNGGSSGGAANNNDGNITHSEGGGGGTSGSGGEGIGGGGPMRSSSSATSQPPSSFSYQPQQAQSQTLSSSSPWEDPNDGEREYMW